MSDSIDTHDWVTITADHAAMPLSLNVPPRLAGKLFAESDERGSYVVSLPDPFLGSLQVGKTGVDSPEAFEKTNAGYGAVTTWTSAPTAVAGRSGVEACGEVKTPQPAMHTTSGAKPVSVEVDVFRMIYVGDVRLGYRLPKSEAERWQPILDAIIASARWKP